MAKRGLVAHSGDRTYVIYKDPTVGYYLFVLEGGICFYDSLQDDFETIMEFALDEFGVDESMFREETYPPELDLG